MRKNFKTYKNKLFKLVMFFNFYLTKHFKSNVFYVFPLNKLYFEQMSNYHGDISLVKHHFVLSITMAISMGLTWVSAYLILLSDNELYQTITSWFFACTCSLQVRLAFCLYQLENQKIILKNLPIYCILQQFKTYSN